MYTDHLTGPAVTHVTESLQLIRQTGDALATYCGLEVAAWIAHGRGEPRRAATLFGAAAARAETMGSRVALWPGLATNHEQAQQQVRHALGAQAFDAAFEHGHTLPQDDAIAYALGQQPERPQPAPNTPDPHAGPLSTLTRREHQIAPLLAQGLSNKEIATRLVLSPRTVEGHVDRILRKLDCTSRAQAAALIVAMAPDTDQGPS